MTKAELVMRISSKTGLEPMIVRAVIEEVMGEIKSEMMKGNNTYLRGFGSFILKTQTPKRARNISTGESVMIPERNIPAFKPAREFKGAITSKSINHA